MRQAILAKIQSGSSILEMLKSLDGAQLEGRALKLSVHPYSVPYLDHTIAGVVDGPPTSRVLAVISGQDPAGHGWRRMTLSRTGPWQYELEVFPTPFGDADAPLAPGIPPGMTHSGGHH